MSISQFNMTRDINGYNGFGLAFSDTKYGTTLAVGVEQTLTVPNTGDSSYPYLLAVFSFDPGSSIWVAKNATATVAGASFATTNSELNPAARKVSGGDVLHFITTDTSVEIGVSFYATA